MNKLKVGFVSVEYVIVASIVIVAFILFAQGITRDDSIRFNNIANRIGESIPLFRRDSLISPPNREFCFSVNPSGVLYSYMITCGTDVVIPVRVNGIEVVTIGQGAFLDSGLRSVTIPEGVRTIENNAFQGNELSVVIIPDSVTFIGANAFFDNNLVGMFVPLSVTYIGESAFNNNNLPRELAIIFARSANGVDSGKIVSYGGAATHIDIPYGTREIGPNAFNGAAIESLVVAETVTVINDFAFANNALNYIIFRGGIPSVGVGAFSGNLNLSRDNSIEVSSSHLNSFRAQSVLFGAVANSFFVR